MVIPPVQATALTGLRRGLEGMQKNAAEIASAGQFNGTAEKPIEQSLVEQKQYAQNVQANARSLQVSFNLIGSILDIKV